MPISNGNYLVNAATAASQVEANTVHAWAMFGLGGA
jgi:hypothetical protein